MTETEFRTFFDREALWKAVLAKVDEIGKGMNRSQAFYGADGWTCMAIAEKQQDDGTWLVYEITARGSKTSTVPITVSVAESVRVGHRFWEPIASNPDRLERVVVGDRCYTVRPDGPNPDRHNGFGGRLYVIEWLDESGEPTGETTETRNLWSRGVVPPQYRDRLAPNARFADVSRRSEVSA
jgi:hypothetical protein